MHRYCCVLNLRSAGGIAVICTRYQTVPTSCTSYSWRPTAEGNWTVFHHWSNICRHWEFGWDLKFLERNRQKKKRLGQRFDLSSDGVFLPPSSSTCHLLYCTPTCSILNARCSHVESTLRASVRHWRRAPFKDRGKNDQSEDEARMMSENARFLVRQFGAPPPPFNPGSSAPSLVGWRCLMTPCSSRSLTCCCHVTSNRDTNIVLTPRVENTASSAALGLWTLPTFSLFL